MAVSEAAQTLLKDAKAVSRESHASVMEVLAAQFVADVHEMAVLVKESHDEYKSETEGKEGAERE